MCDCGRRRVERGVANGTAAGLPPEEAPLGVKRPATRSFAERTVIPIEASDLDALLGQRLERAWLLGMIERPKEGWRAQESLSGAT